VLEPIINSNQLHCARTYHQQQLVSYAVLEPIVNSSQLRCARTYH